MKKILFLFIFMQFAFAKGIVILSPYGTFSTNPQLEPARSFIVGNVLIVFTVFYCLKFFIFRFLIHKKFSKIMMHFLIISILAYFITIISCLLHPLTGAFIASLVEAYYYYFVFRKKEPEQKYKKWLKTMLIVNYSSYFLGASFFHFFIFISKFYN